MAAPLNPPDDSIAPRLLIPVGIIIGIGLPIYITRMYSRLRIHKKLSCDDYAITLAQICCIVGYALVAVSCKYGLGRHTIHVSPSDRSNAMFYFWLQVNIWYVGMTGMKISVASMLIRMQQHSATWKWVLWIMMSVQVIVNVSAIIFAFIICIPLRAQWNRVPGAKCIPTRRSHAHAYAYISINIMTDLLLSLMPLTFICRLHRPKFERVVIGILMCLGLTATAAAIKRLADMIYMSLSGDVLHHLLVPTMWCMLEEVLGVTAASIPYLKSPAERTLRRLGLLHVSNEHEASPSQMGLPSFRIPDLESSNANGETGSSKDGKAGFELDESSRTAGSSK
ncbi:hypothetical protein DM02DRAFT_677967 [Periconia macrospinosa]|uniref:Rhodopsin domain-containing protein n=1 Tax=Periconia macrospinosa TaxID=97972 RepID=A0A2V1D0W7_9PLEO|nr:hypothetical protein DM02DRAFT_677967 [Periconia macrospinosa]